MLQALFKEKLGRAIQGGYFQPIEDTLTSSVIGLLQYLPDALFWELLRDSCGSGGSLLPRSIGEIKEIHFWERMDAKGTYNSQSVEPDVWIETEAFDVIIEAKRSDSSYDNAQSTYQWFNEIVALDNHYDNDYDKELIFIAMGGNESLKNQSFSVNGKEFIIYTASWFDLLASILKHRAAGLEHGTETNTLRILDDSIKAMQYHHIVHTVWFDSLTAMRIHDDAENYLRADWIFENRSFLAAITESCNRIEFETLSGIWTIR